MANALADSINYGAALEPHRFELFRQPARVFLARASRMRFFVNEWEKGHKCFCGCLGGPL